MTELYLVRHGETDWNRERRVQGRTDIPLNDTGRAQAAAVAELLAGHAWDGVYTSPLVRAAETAAIIAAQVGLGAPVAIAELVERDYGAAEGMIAHDIDARWPRWEEVPGRESREAAAARVVPALVALADAHPGERILVVSHGGAIRAVLSESDPGVDHGPITNCSVHSFHHDAGSLRLIAFDDRLERDSLLPGAEDIDAQNLVEARDDGVA